ncbi:Ferredoxin reductase [metagenome]|uniref:Ferredoxin reductase n=1 Tax=metagenome TaxID=256318 RepID=A0A2P2CGV1_9ZZZZ
MATERIVIIGGGLAAATAVTELRTHGFAGQITLVTEETHLPYERPPLSKAVLLGEKEPDSALVHDQAWYDEHAVDVHLGVRVDSVNRDARQVLAGDLAFTYDQLLIATGARPRALALADDSGASVSYLRTIDDSLALRARFRPGLRLGVIGGGWIGLEAASAARQADCDVTVIEMAALPLLGVLGEEVASVFADLHREHGVHLLTGAEIRSITTDGEGAVVSLADGDHAFDHLVVGVGVQPNVELAEAAGLDVDNGIRTDDHLRTSDPLVFAAGDVANADHPVLGRPLRVEHWDTSIQHGKVAAANLAGGDLAAAALPYFFTDQYDFGMEYVGNTAGGYDRVILRGDVAAKNFTAWWLDGTRVVAGMHANDWEAIDDVRRIVGSTVDPDRLADESVALSDV